MQVNYTGERVSLRPITLADCTEEYVSWLRDPEVNRYLETRWQEKTLASVQSFVTQMIYSGTNRLMAIIENATCRHIGNIKIGQINIRHLNADISYFIGNRGSWGKGYATDAIKVATEFGFKQLGLRTIKAGLYSGNIASQKALAKCGYTVRGEFPEELYTENGWESHVWMSITSSEFERGASC